MKLVFALLLISRLAFGTESLVSKAQSCVSAKDDLCLRVTARKIRRTKMNAATWATVRALLQSRPAVGWDLIQEWDQANPAMGPVDKAFAAADELMSAGNYRDSTTAYNKLAESVRDHGVDFGQPNFFLYQTILHSLARSYYAQGSYRDAIQIYGWISLNYPYLRQVQFEKMWAGSLASDPSVTLGALASQMSSYYSKYLEPEAYLVQYYTYKRLCRADDLKLVSNAIVRFKSVLDKNQLTLEEWARRDNETLALWRLTDPRRGSSDLISPPDRQREVNAIRASLTTRFRADVVRLKTQMQKVSAYLNLSGELQNKELPRIGKVEGVEKFVKAGEEMWPVQDGEEWLDEIGQHVFAGRSKCGK